MPNLQSKLKLTRNCSLNWNILIFIHKENWFVYAFNHKTQSAQN